MLKNVTSKVRGGREMSKEFGRGIQKREPGSIRAVQGRNLRIRQSISYRIQLRGMKLKEMPLNLRSPSRGRLAVFLCNGGMAPSLQLDLKLRC